MSGAPLHGARFNTSMRLKPDMFLEACMALSADDGSSGAAKPSQYSRGSAFFFDPIAISDAFEHAP
jgi:hypothetical protein